MSLDVPLFSSVQTPSAEQHREEKVTPSRPMDFFAAWAVYRDGSFDEAKQQLERFSRMTDEDDRATLNELALPLFEAIDAHEQANDLAYRSWQKTMRELRSNLGEQELSRDIIEQAFRSHPDAHEIERLESLAINSYRRVLQYLEEELVVRPGITISTTDIESLVNDLAYRRVSRHRNDHDRVMRLRELNIQLKRIADEASDTGGKRLELEELLLLRTRLLPSATEHLIQIEHGTLREDLRPELGNVDLILTVCGRPYPLQVKTYVRDLGYAQRAKQYDQLLHAKVKAHGHKTKVIELDRTLVEKLSAQQRNREYLDPLLFREAFDPLFDVLDPADRTLLLGALHLSDEEIAHEREKLAEKARAIEANRRALDRVHKPLVDGRPTPEEWRAQREAEQRAAEKEAAERAAATARAEEERRRIRAQADEIARQAQLAKAAKAAKVEQALRRKIGAEKAANTRAMNAQERAAFWHQDPVMALTLPKHLIRLGLLETDWTPTQIDALNQAKQAFALRYGRAKPGKIATLKDPVNDAFMRDFPTESAYLAATARTWET
jgi:flagellar biosynthesis GTPase FlhF